MKYNIASKHYQSIHRQEPNECYHKCDYRSQKEPPNTQKVMMTGKSSLLEDNKVASTKSLISREERKRENRALLDFFSSLDFWARRRSDWTLRLRDTTDFYSGAEGRKSTNSSHRDLLIFY